MATGPLVTAPCSDRSAPIREPLADGLRREE